MIQYKNKMQNSTITDSHMHLDTSRFIWHTPTETELLAVMEQHEPRLSGCQDFYRSAEQKGKQGSCTCLHG